MRLREVSELSVVIPNDRCLRSHAQFDTSTPTTYDRLSTVPRPPVAMRSELKISHRVIVAVDDGEYWI